MRPVRRLPNRHLRRIEERVGFVVDVVGEMEMLVGMGMVMVVRLHTPKRNSW